MSNQLCPAVLAELLILRENDISSRYKVACVIPKGFLYIKLIQICSFVSFLTKRGTNIYTYIDIFECIILGRFRFCSGFRTYMCEIVAIRYHPEIILPENSFSNVKTQFSPRGGKSTNSKQVWPNLSKVKHANKNKLSRSVCQ